MELSRFVLILSTLFISFKGNLLSDIPPPSPKKEILTENPHRNLEEKTNNYILITYRNYSIENRFTKPLKSLEHYFDADYDRDMEYAEIIDLTHFDSSEVENINYMFAGCKSLKSINFGEFSTIKVTTMNSVFLNCNSLTSLNLSFFDTSKVKDTSSMFKNCISLTYLDISNFNLLNVDKDDSMFDNLNSLTYVNLKNSIDKGNAILKMEEKLSYRQGLVLCRNGYTNPLDSFIYCCDYSFERKLCLEKKNYITIYYNRFVEYSGNFNNRYRGGINFIYNEYDNTTLRAGDLKYIYGYSKIEIHFHFPLTTLDYFFCRQKKSFEKMIIYQGRISYFERDGYTYAFDSNMQYLISADFSHFDSSKVRSMVSLFEDCTSLRSVNFGYFYNAKVESMEYMFFNCNNLISVDFSTFDTSQVTSFFLIFDKCYEIISADLSNLNTLKVLSFTPYFNLFEFCGKLKYLNIKDIKHGKSEYFYNYLMGGLGERDLDVCQTENIVEGSKIRNICCDFNIAKGRCESSNYILLYYNKNIKYNNFINKYRNDISFILYNEHEYLKNEINISPGVKLELHFLENVNSMESFFDSNYDSNMKYLASTDFSHFNTILVRSFKNMFYGCISLTSINLSNLTTGYLESTKSMFEGCSSLLSVNISNFLLTDKINNAENMFKNCSSLKILDISNFKFSTNNNYLNMFVGINDLKYLGVLNITDQNKIISKSPLNEINDLLVCQNANNIINLNIYNICCPFNIETETCESVNHMVLKFNQDSYYKNGFKNDFRDKIYYLVYDKQIITENKEIYITSGGQLYIYFNERVRTMENFFDTDYDENMKNLVSIDLSHFDLTLVSRFKKMFYGCSSLLSINLSNFQISNFAFMQSMFEGCVSLLSINLTSTKTVYLFNGENMFKNCLSLRLIDISNYYISYISNSTDMFANVNNLRYIKLINIQDRMSIINKSPLNGIDNLIACQNKEFITNKKAKKFCCDFSIETNKCENDYYITLYYNKDSYYINGFKNYYRENINYIVYNDEILSEKKEIYIKAGYKLEIHYNFPIYDLHNFFDCENDNNMNNVISVDLSHFNFSLITNMNYMFYKCYSIQSIYFPNSSEISQIVNMSKLFSGCNSLLSLNLSKIITSNTKDLSYMFENCTSLKVLDISEFNFKNKNVTDMFLNVNNIKYLGLYNTIDNDKFISKSKLNEIDELFVCQKNNIISNTKAVNICCNYYNIETDLCESDNFISIYFAKDVIYYYGFKNNMRNNISFIIHENLTYPGKKKLNIKANSKVEIHFNNPVHNLESFFDSSYESRVEYIISIDFSHFDASLVTNFKKMFHKCNKLEFIDFSNFNTSNANDMSLMFAYCNSLLSLDLSSFNTRQVKYMNYMFFDCNSLLSLDIYNFDFENIISSTDIFYNIKKIKYINIFHAKDKDNIISGSILNETDNLIVCQKKKEIISNKNAINDCCHYDIISKTCESNYIVLNFLDETYVSTYHNEFMKRISYIIYSGEMIINESFTVDPNKEAELHFIYPISDLSEFFLLSDNKIMENVKSVNFSKFNSNYVTNISKIFYECNTTESIDFSNFNTSNVIDMSYMFYHCDSLNYLDLSSFDTSKVTSVENMFYFCSNLIYIDLSHFNSKNILSSNDMFKNIEILKYIDLYYAKDDHNILSGSYLNEINNLTVCQRENIITNENINNSCCKYNIETNICESTNYIIVYYGKNDTEYNSGFVNEYRKNIKFIIYENSRFLDTEGFTIKSNSKIEIYFSSPLTTLESFFDQRYDERVVNIISIDFSYFDSSLITSIGYIFNGCCSLLSIDLTNFISTFITRMDYMFNDCSSLKSLDLSNINTSSLISANSLFKNCTSLKFLDISSFNLKNLKDLDEIFDNLTNLKYINLYDIETSELFLNETNKELNNIDNLIVCQNSDIITNPNVKQICCDFNIETDLCESSNYIIVYYGQNDTEYDSDFINKYRNNISFIIYENYTLGINNKFTIKSDSKIEIHFSFPLSTLESFFDKRYDEKVVNIIYIDFTYFDSSFLTSLYNIFYGCSSLISSNFTNFDTSLVTNMAYMFFGCDLLLFIDLSYLNTSLVSNMSNMFSNCDSLITMDLSNLDTSSVYTFDHMFYECSSLLFIDLSNFNTTLATNMDYMFYGCISLISIDLSNFNTLSLVNIDYMLYGCISLKIIDISGFNLTNIEEASNLFYNLTNLKYINLINIEASEIFLNEANKDLNNTDNLIVCQNSDIITNPNIKQICCDFNIETDLCESSNYIIVYYGLNDTEYNSDFINKYRNNISFIIYENYTLGINNKFTIKADSKIEIHFSSPLTTLESFLIKDMMKE